MRIRRALVLGLLLALSAAGCGGGGGGDQVATAGGTAPDPSASAKQDNREDRDAILQYAKCMRENGVPDFPDPEFGEGGIGLTIPDGADKAKVDAAQEKCKQYLPNGGQPTKVDPAQLEKMREYAKCIRENGVPNFPDPSEEGGIALDMDKLGLSGPDDPKLKAAEEKCRSIMPGGGPGGARTTKKDS